MKSLFLFLFSATAALAQPISFGVKAGVPLTDFVSTAKTIGANNYNIFTSHINRYIVGATGELRLPLGLSIELDALYRRLNYQNNSGSTGITTVNTVANTSGNAWEFPLLAKYRFAGKTLRPFLDAGVAWDTLQGLKQDVTSVVGPAPTTRTGTSTPAELAHKTTRGYVLGAGLDIKLLVLHIQPEVRFTRWGAQHFVDPNALLHSNLNQGEFLVGITF